MRIDYSEPKQAFVAGKGKPQPRKESKAVFATFMVVVSIITFGIGFGTGWFFSQRSAKQSFKDAMAQKSLENSPKQPDPPKPQPVTPPQPPVSQPAVPPGSQPLPQQGNPLAAGTTPAEQPLTFYKTLPSGQKNNAMGSGINSKDDTSKQPLQAPIPSNVAKPAVAPATDAPRTQSEKPSVKGGFAVQMASTTLKSEAETLKNKFAAKGYHAYIVESNQGDKGLWYRVRIGKKLEQEAAKELASKLGKPSIVIPDQE